MIAFIVLASRQNIDLVRKAYYEEELRFQQQLDRLNRTQAVSRQLEISYDSSRQSIRILLPPIHASANPVGQIHFYRPSDASLDHRLRLAVNGQGRQDIDASHLQAGLWKVRITWTVNEREYFFDQQVIVPSQTS